MLDYRCDPMINQSWLPSSAWMRQHRKGQVQSAQEDPDFAEHVPVMVGTVLGLELLLREPCLDLQMASEMVLSDFGATIQILVLVGKENDWAGGQPRRMGDCLASLDVGVWFDAISARTFPCDHKHLAMTEVWKHSRLVAQYAQLVAESLEGISADDAYLVGLLHEIGAITSVLGWANGKNGRRNQTAFWAMERTLPLFVLAAMRSVNDPDTSSTWRLILSAAHELAGDRTDVHASGLQAIDSMGICSRWKGFPPFAVSCHSDARGGQRLGVREGRETRRVANAEPCPGVLPTAAIEADTACAAEQNAGCNSQSPEARTAFMF